MATSGYLSIDLSAKVTYSFEHTYARRYLRTMERFSLFLSLTDFELDE